MDRRQRVDLISNTFHCLERNFKKDPRVETNLDLRDKGYDPNAYTRVVHKAEYYFQEQWERELEKQFTNLRVDREVRPPKKLNSYHSSVKAKIADLVVADINHNLDNVFAPFT